MGNGVWRFRVKITSNKNMRILILFAVVGSIPLVGFGKATPLEEARTVVGEWVAAEKAISKEEVEWEEEKVVLADLIAVAEAKIGRLEKELEENQETRSFADQTRQELLEQEERLAEEVAVIEEFLGEIEIGLRRFEPRLPDPLRTQLSVPFQRLPRDPSESRLSHGERMQTVITLLTGIREFDGKITISEETRQLPGRIDRGRFRTLWLGLSQAYFLAPDDAGFGIPGSNGWEWHSRPELAGAIGEAIAIAEQSAMEPRLIDLPIKIQGAGNE